MVYLLSLLLLLSFQSYHADIKSESISLANAYLSSYFSQEKNKDLYLWAFNELHFSTCLNEDDTIDILKSFQSNRLYSFYSGITCSPGTVARQKFLTVKRLSLEFGFSSLALYYLAYENSTSERTKFTAAFLKKWAMTLSKDEVEVISDYAQDRKISVHTDFFLNNHFESFLLLTNESVESFPPEVLDGILTSSLSLNTRSLLERDVNNFTIIKISLLNDHYANARLTYSNDSTEVFLSSFPTSELKLRAYNATEFSFGVLGEYDKALSIQRNLSIPLASYFNNKTQTDNILIRQSSYLFLIGKFQEARIILERLYNDPETQISRAHLFNNLAICYEELGEKNKYISLLLEALQASEQRDLNLEENYKESLSIYRNLFLYYNSIGDSSSALNYINRAEALATQVNDSLELAAIHSRLASYYWENYKDFKKSIAQIRQAETIFSNSENYRFSIDLLLDKTDILIAVDSLRAAENELLKIIDITQSRSDTRNYIYALTNLALIQLKQGDLSSADKYLSEISLYPLDALDFEEVIHYHTVYTKYLYAQGKYREGLLYLTPNVEQITDRVKESIDSETGYWASNDIYLEAYHTLIQAYLELDRPYDALAQLDELNTINEANLYNSPILRASRLTEEELTRDKKLNDQIQSLRGQYLTTTGNERQALKARIDYLSAQRQSILNKVRRSNKKQDIPVWAVQKMIKPDEMIIHFSELNNSLYITRLTSGSISLDEVLLTNKNRDLLERSAIQLASGESNLLDLFKINKLLELDQIPDHIQHIAVIPDNYLYRIPLDILPKTMPNSATSFGSTRYLIEDYSFKYFTSLKEFALSNHVPSVDMKTDLSAFAISFFEDFEHTNLPALPYATKEVRMIEGVLNNLDSKQLFIGDNATKSNFKDQIEQSSIVHIATHSEISEKDPLFSTIYLNSDLQNTEQGQAIYAYELFDHQLHNELIMLNSCSSGSGSYMQGSGIVGISRALRSAGARSLALNLWNVNDKIASEFAEDFYFYLNDGYSKNEAMRMAKINQLKYGNADPHYWGAYTLIGDSSPIIKRPAGTPILYSFLLGLTLLVSYKVRKESSYLS